jgi:hypothetical protein
VRQAELFDQLLICTGLVERVEILPVQIFHEGLFEAHGIVGLVHKGRNRLKSGTSRSPASTLTGDELELLRADLPHKNGLENADRFNRINESGQPLFPELVAWLERVRPDTGERDLPEH